METNSSGTIDIRFKDGSRRRMAVTSRIPYPVEVGDQLLIVRRADHQEMQFDKATIKSIEVEAV